MKQASMRDGTSKEACRSILRSADQRVRILDHQVAEEGEDAAGASARLSDPEPGTGAIASGLTAPASIASSAAEQRAPDQQEREQQGVEQRHETCQKQTRTQPVRLDMAIGSKHRAPLRTGAHTAAPSGPEHL
jgi:hypothetical protein